MVRNSTGLLDVEEERYRLLVRNMTDVVTRHGRGGSVLFVSPAAVSNALKFTDRGGRVTVGAKIDGAVLAITVQDTGVEIGPEDLARVGQPFFQARASYDRSFDGSGLGLSIVQGLVMLHGGHMDIASHVGEGTDVTVRLPIDCQGARPMRVRQSETISQSTFERVIEASRDLEKKRA